MAKARPTVPYLWLIGLITAWLSTVGPAMVEGGHGEEENLDSITPERVKLLLDSGEKLLFIDLRSVKEFNEKRLPGARSIPVEQLNKRFQEIPRIGRIILYCACRPGDDTFANFFLRDIGYRNITVMEEGFQGWVKRKYPVESGQK
ncbi:MAG TPA: rhodanese-like domain-containing protein [Candidatus Binatia bacterium]|nr:rhodanese-like domain-containing protein [Candidatus Binatia bacterium]